MVNKKIWLIVGAALVTVFGCFVLVFAGIFVYSRFVTSTQNATNNVPETPNPNVVPADVTQLTYENDLVRFTYPSDWTVEKDLGEIVLLRKGDYLFGVSRMVVTGGGFGYPYDGVCYFSTENPVTITDKFVRNDYTVDTAVNDITGTNAAKNCRVNNLSKSGKLWLGSRLVYKPSTITVPGISIDEYFENNQDTPKHPSEIFIVAYMHGSFSDSFSAFASPTAMTSSTALAFVEYGDPKMVAAVAEMDAIVKTLTFKEEQNTVQTNLSTTTTTTQFNDCVGYQFTETGKPGVRFTGNITTSYPVGTVVKNVNTDTQDNFCVIEYNIDGSKLHIDFEMYALMLRGGATFGITPDYTTLHSGFTKLIDYSTGSLYRNGLYKDEKGKWIVEYGSGVFQNDKEACQMLWSGSSDCFFLNQPGGFYEGKVGSVGTDLKSGLTETEANEIVQKFDYIIQNTTATKNK